MPALAESVLERAVSDGDVSVCGPATALRLMFTHFGWDIKPDGTFKGPDNVWFSVRLSGARTITVAIEAAFAEQVRLAKRHGVGASAQQGSWPAGRSGPVEAEDPSQAYMRGLHVCSAGCLTPSITAYTLARL